jgi:macrolide transport system ATP-binding/permease protein
MPEWKEEIRRRLTDSKLEPAREAEIIEELSQHLEDRYAESLTRGAMPDEAYRAALAELREGETLQRELQRVERSVEQEPIVLGTNRKSNMIADFWQDLRYGVRMLGKQPGFTAVVTLMLALGIGVNATVFSIINSTLFRPLPVDDTEGLVFAHQAVSYPEYEDYLQQGACFTGLAAHALRPLALSDGDQTKQVFGEIVTGSYFSVLKIQAAIGRTFSQEEDHLAAPPVIVVSHNFWTRRLNADPAWVGKPLTLNGQIFTVVGIAPPAFTGTMPGISTDLWMPMTWWAQTSREQYRLNRPGGYNAHWLLIVGRLNTEFSPEQAAAALSTIASRSERRRDGKAAALRIALSPVDRGHPGLRSGVLGKGLPAFVGILVLSALVLLIACANVANLQLARGAARQHEIAVRLTLGGSRSRLIRQLLTESFLLALLASLAGLLLAFWATSLLTSFEFKSLIPIPTLALDLKLDWRIVSYLLLISMATGIAFGLAPALQSSKPNLVAFLKEEGNAIATSSRRFSLRNLFVVTQVTVSLVLLIAGGLFARGLFKGLLVDPGFRSDNVLVLSLDPSQYGYPATKAKGFERELLERLETLPGAESATVVSEVPLQFGGDSSLYTIESSDSLAQRQLSRSFVGPRFFNTVSIPLLRGRDFSQRDTESAPWVAIINETMARQYWRGQDPIGKRIRYDINNTWIDIIGVAKDAKYLTLGERPQPWMYLPAFQHPHYNEAGGGFTLLARTSGDPMKLAAGVSRVVKDIDASFPVLNFQTLAQSIEIQLLVPRLAATVLGILGIVGLLLAMVGLYGVMSYATTQRTREIGVRMAMGAQTGDINRLIIGQGLRLTMLGVVLGITAAAGLSSALFSIPFLATLLFDISPLDPLVYSGCIILLTGVALLACYLPARRAASVDPMVALRYE